MSAYLIVSYDIKDPKTYEAYVPGVIPILARHGGEVLVADHEARALEGASRTVEVVLRFASMDAARAFYDDPDYAPVRAIRFASTANGRLVLAQGFAPAGG